MNRFAKCKNAQGFTLIEMILTVAVMAILVATTTPAIYEFIRQRDKQNEEVAQLQVRKALEAYIADKGVPPVDTTPPPAGTPYWYEALAGYTSLSQNEISNDVWGRPRTYIAKVDTSRSIYGTTVSVSYVTLHSMGENGQASASDSSGSATGVSVNNGSKTFNGSTSSGTSGWWKNMADPAEAFAGVRAADDDQMMRYTNYEDVLNRYNATRERMDKISEALETYARTEYANHVATCAPSTQLTTNCNADGTPRQGIYYPRSTAVYAKTDSARYIQKGGVVTNVVVDNSLTNVADRRGRMEDLMILLGLPLEYCCSALNNASDGKPVPFYYFSNPRGRGNKVCAARPTADQPKLPARITTQNNPDSDTYNTCG